MIFLVRCPKCRNQMKYQTTGLLAGKSKCCVYCNRSFQVKDHLVR